MEVYKYILDRTLIHNIVTAPIIKPLRVDFQRCDPCLWAIVDTNKEPESSTSTSLNETSEKESIDLAEARNIFEDVYEEYNTIACHFVIQFSYSPSPRKAPLSFRRAI